MACSSAGAKKLCTESHSVQWRKFWPQEGNHILAQFDDDTVIVYQAFKPSIAQYAVQHQRFGGGDFSFGRMSWIKTNFLWMMYRCGWAEKHDQECVLAVRITREGFETILAHAYTASLQKSKKLSNSDITVRLQWDPDHTPTGEKVTRRAIQLGLKGQILERYSTEWVIQIEDITEFVKQQHTILNKSPEDLVTPSERVYPLLDSQICARIQLSFYEEHHKHPVVVTRSPPSVDQQLTITTSSDTMDTVTMDTVTMDTDRSKDDPTTPEDKSDSASQDEICSGDEECHGPAPGVADGSTPQCGCEYCSHWTHKC